MNNHARVCEIFKKLKEELATFKIIKNIIYNIW